jgi:hypothetical protein
LLSTAPTNPTGTPMMAAGLGAPASISSSSRNSAVGALPMAITAPSMISPRDRPAPPSASSHHGRDLAHLRIIEQALHLVARRHQPPDHPMAHHLRVTEPAHRLRAPPARLSAKPFRHDDVISQIDHAAGMDHPHHHLLRARIKRARSASAPDNGEGAPVDFRGITDRGGRTQRLSSSSCPSNAARADGRHGDRDGDDDRAHGCGRDHASGHGRGCAHANGHGYDRVGDRAHGRCA